MGGVLNAMRIFLFLLSLVGGVIAYLAALFVGANGSEAGFKLKWSDSLTNWEWERLQEMKDKSDAKVNHWFIVSLCCFGLSFLLFVAK